MTGARALPGERGLGGRALPGFAVTEPGERGLGGRVGDRVGVGVDITLSIGIAVVNPPLPEVIVEVQAGLETDC